MASTKEELDAAEKNIIYLKELKAFLVAKNKLLKIQHLETNPKDTSEIKIDHERKHLITSLIIKSNLNTTYFQILLDLFARENIINNESTDDPHFKTYKEKVYRTLQELNQSTNNIHLLIKKIRNLADKHQATREEIHEFEQKYKKNTEENTKETSETKNDEVEVNTQQKERILSRVKKINLMISIINGLIHTTRGIDWEKDPELDEIAGMCRNVYKLK